jgi:hypothetical protein
MSNLLEMMSLPLSMTVHQNIKCNRENENMTIEFKPFLSREFIRFSIDLEDDSSVSCWKISTAQSKIWHERTKDTKEGIRSSRKMTPKLR